MTARPPPSPDYAKARFETIKAAGGEPRYYMRMGQVWVRDIAKEKSGRSTAAARKTADLVDEVARMVAEREGTRENYTAFAQRLIALIKGH